MAQWEIQARSRHCSRCERQFLDGDKYRCVLSYREEQPARRDFCEGCWDNRPQPTLDEGEELISWWKSTVRIPPPPPKEEAIKRSLAEQLLRKYLDLSEPKHVNFRYILALMLERRRVLSQKHTVDEDPSGRTLLVYEHTRTGETFLIEDPRLSLSKIDQVQAQVKEILDSEEKPKEAEPTQETTEQTSEAQDQTEEESQA